MSNLAVMYLPTDHVPARKLPIFAIALLASFFLAGLLRADVVHLDDGTQVEGRLAKTVEGWKVTQADGAVITIKSDRVLSIEAGKSAGAGAAADRLASLRRAVDHLSDARQIVDRYQKFLDQNTDPAVLDEANKDLAVWQQRVDQGLVKLASQWVSAQERDRLRQVAQTEAQSARDLLSQNRPKDALAAIAQSVADDPTSAPALFLQGVILYKQEQITPALKAFESANQLQANDAATLNNLGVINWRQKSPVAALNYYDQAMLARPMDRQILDNVAEALHALPPENAKAPAAMKAARDFQDQDSQLQQTLAKDGQYRWGSTWVTAKQLDDLKLAENRVKERVDNLARDYDALQAKVGEIDAEVDANNREMHRLQASVTYVDTNGTVIQLPLPRTYFDLQNDNIKLAANRKTLQTEQENLKVRVKLVQKEVPSPKFSGLQKILEENSTASSSSDSLTHPSPATLPSATP